MAPWLLALALVASAPDATPGEPTSRWVLEPAAAQLLQDAAAPHRLAGPVLGDWTWTGLSIDRALARARLEGPDGAVTLVLRHPTSDDRGQLEISIDGATSPEGQQAAEALADRLRDADRRGALASLWSDRGATPPAAATPVSPRAADPAARRLWLLYTPLWLAALLAAAARALAGLRRAPWSATLALLALFALGLALRLGLATWGPGDHHMNLASSLPGHDASFDLEYGLAPSGLLAPLLLLAPSLTAIVLVNAIAGALAPAIAAALARAIGLARWPAWLSGLTLAIHPVLVRHGGEANRQPLVLLPALVALWALARHGERGRIGWLLLAACGAALCLGARPEAALLLPLLSLPILACGPGLRETAAELRRGRLNSTARAALLALAITLAWSLLRLPAIPAAALRGTTGDAPRLLGTLLWLDPALTPIPLTMLALLGLALGLRDRRALATLPALAVLSLVVAPYPTEGDQLCNARYHTLTLIPFALLVGLGLERLLERLARPQDLRPRARGLTLALLGLLLALASWGPLRRATAPRSEDLELRFLLETAPTLPPGATVIVVNHGDDALLKSYQLIPRTRAPDQTWLKFHEAKDALQGGWTGGPRVYYHAGACSSDRLRDASRAECDEAARHLRRRPLHVTTLPELHSLAGERRPGRAVELGFYQL